MSNLHNNLQSIQAATGESLSFQGITVGTVVCTNDPQEIGRVRAVCPLLGDRLDMALKEIPWAQYGAPFAGNTYQGTRGPGEDETDGGVSYGMWGIPKVGSQVLIMCIDGDTNFRVWVGCLPASKTPSTAPHGRYSYQGGSVDGPLSSEEEPIQPLYDNQTTAFGDRTDNFEWRTRGADYNITALKELSLAASFSNLLDDKDVSFARTDNDEPFISTQGYAKHRTTPDLEYTSTLGSNYESSVYSWTSPGFSSISMDDRVENCRVKFRTSAGHQIIMDDTNERIYINTANGATWIQLDEDGNIDIYSEKKLSMRSEGDINISSDKTVRIYGKEGVQIRSQAELKMYSQGNMDMYTDAEFNLYSVGNLDLYTESDLNLYSVTSMNLKTSDQMLLHSVSSMNLKTDDLFRVSSVSNLNLNSASDVKIQSSGVTDVVGGGDINMDAPNIFLNSGSSGPADSAGTANTADIAGVAIYTNRVPQHEPWGRCDILDEGDTLDPTTGNHEPKYEYSSSLNGKDDKVRGKYWHR